MNPLAIVISGGFASTRAHGRGASPHLWRRADRSASSGDLRDPTATADGISGLMVGGGPGSIIGIESSPVRGSIRTNGRILLANSEAPKFRLAYHLFEGTEV